MNSKFKITHAAIFVIGLWILNLVILINNKSRGTFGDMFGTINSIFTGLALVGVFYTAQMQRKELHDSEEERKNLEKDRVLQQFENTFFHMLENHHRIIESMDLITFKEIPYNDIQKNTTIYINEGRLKANGRDCFRNIHSYFRSLIIESKLKGILDVSKCYNDVQIHYKSDLHHYFRFIYHILKFIKKSRITDEQKFQYASILRATLSAHELVLIFYNGLHENGKTHFKPLMEEYAFLKNLDRTLLLHDPITENGEYHEITFVSSEERLILLQQWKLEQKNNK